jgi:hypothetical protein
LLRLAGLQLCPPTLIAWIPPAGTTGGNLATQSAVQKPGEKNEVSELTSLLDHLVGAGQGHSTAKTA